jgi:hypothetical protein
VTKSRTASSADQITKLAAEIAEIREQAGADRQELDLIRNALVKARLLKRKRKVGDEVTDGEWESVRTARGYVWLCNFEYLCPCGDLHMGEVEVLPKAIDGQTYTVTTSCGRELPTVIWKDKKGNQGKRPIVHAGIAAGLSTGLIPGGA